MGGICGIFGICACLPGWDLYDVMICTCFAGLNLYDLDFMRNFSIPAKKDLGDPYHDLTEV